MKLKCRERVLKQMKMKQTMLQQRERDRKNTVVNEREKENSRERERKKTVVKATVNAYENNTNKTKIERETMSQNRCKLYE